MTETEAGVPNEKTLWKPMAAVLLCLRIVIGWQLLYEGLAKLLTPDWTAAPYLLLSRGFFPGFFHWLGSSPGMLGAVNFLNTWGLTLIGLALILGVVTRFASACGVAHAGALLPGAAAVDPNKLLGPGGRPLHGGEQDPGGTDGPGGLPVRTRRGVVGN